MKKTKNILIIFLLFLQFTAIGQTNKFERKLKRSIKSQKEMVILCTIPRQNFEIGIIKIITKDDSKSGGMIRYQAFKENILIATIIFYINEEIIKITPTKK